MKLPGMVHARNVRPPLAGATLRSIDESSVASIPGFVRVVSRGNYVAVVCEREEQAIARRAAAESRMDSRPRPRRSRRPTELFDYMRGATPTSSDEPSVRATRPRRSRAPTRVIEAEYEVPFQGHTAIGPAHALADPSDGQMTIYSNDMKSYGLRNGVAQFLDMPRERVRVVYMDGPQVYGRTAADDAGFEAAFLAHELGRPVRVQWMRHEETAWDTKGPAYVFKLRGGLDAQGKLVALEYDALRRRPQPPRLQRARHRADRAAHGQAARDSRPRAAPKRLRSCMRIPNQRMTTHVVGAADDLGDAAAHRQPARPQRSAGDVRVRVVHRRARGGRQAPTPCSSGST